MFDIVKDIIDIDITRMTMNLIEILCFIKSWILTENSSNNIHCNDSSIDLAYEKVKLKADKIARMFCRLDCLLDV